MKAKKLTKEQAAIVGLYTGITCGPFSDIHALAEKLMGCSISTFQFADKALVAKLKELSLPLFRDICA